MIFGGSYITDGGGEAMAWSAGPAVSSAASGPVAAVPSVAGGGSASFWPGRRPAARRPLPVPARRPPQVPNLAAGFSSAAELSLAVAMRAEFDAEKSARMWMSGAALVASAVAKADLAPSAVVHSCRVRAEYVVALPCLEAEFAPAALGYASAASCMMSLELSAAFACARPYDDDLLAIL